MSDTLLRLIIVICWVIPFVAFGGWCMNALALINSDFEKPYRAEIIRSIGVFVPPVGAVTGFITIDDETESEE